MKKLSSFFSLLSLFALAQVGIGTSNPNPKAILDLTSTTKGFLLPRLSQADIIDLGTSLPEGLVIYDTTNKKFLGWDGDSWQNLGYEEANTAPIASGLIVNGNLYPNETLNGVYSYSDGEGDIDNNSIFQWNQATDASGSNAIVLSGTNALSYILQNSDIGKFMQFCVIPGSTTGASPGAMTCSTWFGPVSPLTPTEVSFNNTIITGVGEAAGTQNVMVQINISNPSATNDTTVDVAISGGSATLGSDFTGNNIQTVTFPAASSSSQFISFTILDDAIFDPNETIILTMQNANGGDAAMLGTNTQCTITITDNDPVDCTYGGVARINEFHYDNNGADSNEFVEVRIANPQPDLSCLSQYKLILYNGSNGLEYNSRTFASADQVTNDGSYSYYVFYIAAIQNGAPDGLAIIGPNGTSELLSYEGVFTVDLADPVFGGQTTTDIGIMENGTGTSLESLYLNSSSVWTIGNATPGQGNP